MDTQTQVTVFWNGKDDGGSYNDQCVEWNGKVDDSSLAILKLTANEVITDDTSWPGFGETDEKYSFRFDNREELYHHNNNHKGDFNEDATNVGVFDTP